MTAIVRLVRAGLVVMLVLATRAAAAQPPQPPSPPPPPQAESAKPPADAFESVSPVRLQIVLARFKGDKRVASEPYVVMAMANGQSKVLRTGAEVPVVMGPGAKEPITYRRIGTDIHATVQRRREADARFPVNVTVNATSVYPDDPKQSGSPSFRNYSLNGAAVLGDGQTGEIAAATDSLTGETIRLEATLTIVK